MRKLIFFFKKPKLISVEEHTRGQTGDGTTARGHHRATTRTMSGTGKAVTDRLVETGKQNRGMVRCRCRCCCREIGTAASADGARRNYARQAGQSVRINISRHRRGALQRFHAPLTYPPRLMTGRGRWGGSDGDDGRRRCGGNV